ncbi:hypothetical protein ACIBF5_25310 [Micromonospora sp. NPDC050417]|uniref:hypothetical protein n=1 Tax=Micromonospora sp. NPDC050417 TaxID=3364280 RepID=UPI0037AEDA04
MWTLVIAIYAAVVSTGSLVTAYMAYRSSGPQVSGRAYFGGGPGSAWPYLSVNIANAGRAPITIDSAWLIRRKKRKGWTSGWNLRSDDHPLPVRIEGHESVSWSFPSNEMLLTNSKLAASSWPHWNELDGLEIALLLGSGRTIFIPIMNGVGDVRVENAGLIALEDIALYPSGESGSVD